MLSNLKIVHDSFLKTSKILKFSIMTALDSLLIMLKLLQIAIGITDYCVITNFSYVIWLSQRQPCVTINETASLNQ